MKRRSSNPKSSSKSKSTMSNSNSSSISLPLATMLLMTGLENVSAFAPSPKHCNLNKYTTTFTTANDSNSRVMQQQQRQQHQQQQNQLQIISNNPTQSPTKLNMVWWFGGTPNSATETSTSGEECELVAVRIDRTSANSRRISGEIVVNAPLMDIWAILTDYDNLSTHVPNLVASKRTSSRSNNNNNGGGKAGDGSYKCRLYQRGAQKIVGFEFGADVTMDMTESIVVAGKSGQITKSHELYSDPSNRNVGSNGSSSGNKPMFPEERRINFKCVDSQFFSEFDGTWKVVQMPDNPFTGEPETTVSYTVDVRPKGPVPVAALEWRIREDVPTNLRAVKRAAMENGREVLMKRGLLNGVDGTGHGEGEEYGGRGDMAGFADWIMDYENETLGAYLE